MKKMNSAELYDYIMENRNNGDLVDNILRILADNVNIEEAKKTGMKSTDLQIVNRLVRGQIRDDFKMYHDYRSGNGKEYHVMTDGHYILGTTGVFPAEHCPAEKQFHLEDIIEGTEKKMNSRIEVNKGKLKAFCKLNKHSGVAYVIHVKSLDTYIVVNPRFLADIMDFTGSNVVEFNRNGFTGSNKNYTHTLYIHNEDVSRFGVLLPVNPKEICVVNETCEWF